MSGWDAALDEMTSLAHAFKTPEYRDHIDRFAESLANSGKMYDIETGETISVSSSTADRGKIRRLLDYAVSHVDLAEPTWVNADVTDLVEYAAEHGTFKPQAIYVEDLFSHHAFALFERPMKVLDMRGLEFWFRAISWSVVPTDSSVIEEGRVAATGPALLVCKWSHRNDPDPLRNGSGKLPLLGGSPLRLTHVDQIPFGEDRFLREPRLSTSIAQYESLWRLANQKVVLFAPERTSRATWKRAANWRQLKEVSVLRLRRAEYRTRYEGEGEGRQMSYRTNVRGHWRNQYYSSLGEVGEDQAYRQIWIDEYIKGNPDGPLILKKHAVEFTR